MFVAWHRPLRDGRKRSNMKGRVEWCSHCSHCMPNAHRFRVYTCSYMCVPLYVCMHVQARNSTVSSNVNTRSRPSQSIPQFFSPSPGISSCAPSSTSNPSHFHSLRKGPGRNRRKSWKEGERGGYNLQEKRGGRCRKRSLCRRA